MPKVPENIHPLVLAKKAAGLTYEQLATQCNLSKGYLRQIGCGWRRPSFPVADDVASRLTESKEEQEELTTQILRFRYRPLPVKKKKKAKARRRSVA